MIPKIRPHPSPADDPDATPSGPPVQHSATDVDFAFLGGALLPITITDGDGILTETADKFVYTELAGDEPGEIITVFKASLAYVRRRDRSFETAPKLFTRQTHQGDNAA